MKIKKIRRSFFNIRALISLVLCLVAGMFTLFAFGLAPLGIESLTQRFAGHAAIKLDKDPADPNQAILPANVPYSGPPRDLRPVTPVRSAKLRDIAPIIPHRASSHRHVPRCPATGD